MNTKAVFIVTALLLVAVATAGVFHLIKKKPDQTSLTAATTMLEALPEIQTIQKAVIAAGRKPFFVLEQENKNTVTISLKESFPQDQHTNRIDTFKIDLTTKTIMVYDITTDSYVPLEEWKKSVKERFL